MSTVRPRGGRADAAGPSAQEATVHGLRVHVTAVGAGQRARLAAQGDDVGDEARLDRLDALHSSLRTTG